MKDALTRKALFKMSEKEVFEQIAKIREDGVIFDDTPSEIYVSNVEIIEYANNNFKHSINE